MTGGQCARRDDVHLAFSGDRADVVLDVTHMGSGRVCIEGRMLPLDAEAPHAFEAVVEGPSFSGCTADGDGQGRFGFDLVPDTVDRLRLRARGLVLMLALDLRGGQS